MNHPNLAGAQVFTWGIVEANGTVWKFVPASWWDWVKALWDSNYDEKLVKVEKVSR